VAAGELRQPSGADGSVWRPVDRRQAYEQVLDRIEELIFKRELRDGDRLPAERDLAARLGVSRSAIREALRTLEAQGVIRSATGTGPDAGTIIAAMPSTALTRILRLHVALAKFPLKDVVETRVMLERGSAQLAAEERKHDDLMRMEMLLDKMDDDDVTRAVFNDLDTDFHVAIAEAGGNRLAADMTSAIRQALRHPLLAAFEASAEWPAIAGKLRAQHREIYLAIKDQNGIDAANRVEEHIRGFFETMSHFHPGRDGLGAF
jgi:GntR family transcriptional regulator, transcriptional repressor for pyruvate dehydrogenase complex